MAVGKEIETSIIEMPALSFLIMASRVAGYPVVDKSDLMKFIYEFPTISMEIPLELDNKANDENHEPLNKEQNTYKEPIKLNIINKEASSIINENSIKELESIVNDKEKMDEINDTIQSRFIDFNSEDKFDSFILATAIDFGIISLGNENYCNIDTLVTADELLRMISNTLSNSRKQAVQIILNNEGDIDKKDISLSRGDTELKIDKTSDKFNRKPIKVIDAVYIIVKLLHPTEYNRIDIDDIVDYIGKHNYSELHTDGYSWNKLKALYIAEMNNLVSENDNMDSDITKFRVIKMIISSIIH